MRGATSGDTQEEREAVVFGGRRSRTTRSRVPRRYASRGISLYPFAINPVTVGKGERGRKRNECESRRNGEEEVRDSSAQAEREKEREEARRIMRHEI